MIRVMLVDDHTMIREALRVVLERDGGISVIAEVGDGDSALSLAEQLNPDIVVMDVALPGLSGIETTRRLMARNPATKVLGLSTYLDRRIVQQMLDAGAGGYITKSAAGAELRKGITALVAGRTYVCSEVAGLLAETWRNRPANVPGDGTGRLSQREVQVATLLAEGKSAPEIAKELCISPSTVDVHRRNLMRKLDLHNVVELTKFAIRAGLIVP